MNAIESTARDGPEAEAPEAPELAPAAPVVARIPDVETGPRTESSDDEGDRQRHVLLVEDETLVALDIVEALERAGWAVIGPAATLEEAQALVTSGIRFDAAVLDVNLRGRWAHAVAEELAAQGVPFLVCTGWEMVDPDGRFAGAPVIAKPIVGDTLGVALENLVAPSAQPG